MIRHETSGSGGDGGGQRDAQLGSIVSKPFVASPLSRGADDANLLHKHQDKREI